MGLFSLARFGMSPVARVDYDAIQWPLGRSGVRKGYQPSRPEPGQNPPQSVSGAIPRMSKQLEEELYKSGKIPAPDRPGWDHYSIDNAEVVAALTRNGYKCEPRFDTGRWYNVNRVFEHGVPTTLRDGTVLISHGTGLQTLEEDRRRMWGVTTQEAADALAMWVRFSSITPDEAARRLGLTPPVEQEISPESIDGIEPCGYDAL